MNWDEVRRETLGFLLGVAVSVLVGVAGELAGVQSLQEISLTGLVVTAIRSAATAVLTLLGSRVPGLT